MKLVGTPLGIAGVAGAVAAGGLAFALTSGGSGTHVLGEKITGSGTSAPTTSTTGCNGNGNCNGQGNGNGNGNKTFTIGGTANGLYPGGTVHLQLKVTNALNQDMTVTALSATLGSITKAVDAPAGTCSPTVTIGSWTGTSFTLPANTTNMNATGYLPVSIAHNAPDACQGATFNLNYSGTAVQK